MRCTDHTRKEKENKNDSLQLKIMSTRLSLNVIISNWGRQPASTTKLKNKSNIWLGQSKAYDDKWKGHYTEVSRVKHKELSFKHGYAEDK